MGHHMERAKTSYWKKRLGALEKQLIANHFDVYAAESAAGAQQIVREDILAKTQAKSVSWGGSRTLMATGLVGELKNHSTLTVIDAFENNITREESMERRRQAFRVDLYLTGCNAITETGLLVNLDRTGNRVAALTFGPRYVVVLVGRNKIVPDLAAAMNRIKNLAAPLNAMRLAKATPCAKTAVCQDCKGHDRLCNTWTITEKSLPSGRIKVILIDDELGF